MSGDSRTILHSLERLLRNIGLTRYESKALAYLSLQRRALKASEISEPTKIPRTKVYQVLQSLEDIGLVRTYPGRPRMFLAPSPEELPALLYGIVINDAIRKVSILNKVFLLQLDEGLWALSDVVLPLNGKVTIEKMSRNILNDYNSFLMMVLSAGNLKILPNRIKARDISLIVDDPWIYEELASRGIITKNVRVRKSGLFALITERYGLLADDKLEEGIFSTKPQITKALTVLVRALYLTSAPLK